MIFVAAIFASEKDAENAMDRLKTARFDERNLILLAPGSSQAQVELPAEGGEQPGMGKAIGGVVGGAVGLAGGAAIANLFLPGVGPIIAIGLGAGMLGVGGAVAGAAGGGALENLLTRGLPKDEIFLYEDALRQRRTVVIVAAQDQQQVEQARILMDDDGAESLDAARERWWIGLRDAEQIRYAAPAGNGKNHEQIYRCGFEAALRPGLRGKCLGEIETELRQRYPNIYHQESFRRGYERGQRYFLELASEAVRPNEAKHFNPTTRQKDSDPDSR
jgi:hypothetical protein